MTPNSEPPKTKLYLLLLAIQIAGALAFICRELPEFKQILLNPGKQLPRDAFDDLTAIGIFVLMQITFWCRQWYAPIPFRR
jgi:hypothetical protein